MSRPEHQIVGHRVVRASAGTGKTYTLTLRYLKLLRLGAPPDQILATTFTRKAAGEILERILRRLAEASLTAEGARKLATDLRDPGLELADARAMLAAMGAAMHRAAVSTIDSFFNRVASGFRLELGIPPDPVVLDDASPRAQALRRQAIEAMLADDDVQVLVDLLRRLHHDASKRGVSDSIDEIVASLYDTYRQAPRAEAWTTIPLRDAMSADDLRRAVDGMADFADEKTLARYGKQLAKAVLTFVSAARVGNWESLLGTIGRAAMVEGGTYHKKPLPEPLVAVMRPLAMAAEAEVINAVLRRGEAMHDLTARFDAHYTRLRRTHRVLLFSDLAHVLSGKLHGACEEILADVYYRLDARIRHLLLDEFQDTSIEQWAVLEPFARELASHADGERSVFVVGDVKQAIYGWRGGCAEIFNRVEESLGIDAGRRESLDVSRRSSQVVLDAVNMVFKRIGDAPCLVDHAATVSAWAGGFRDHRAHQTDMPGRVELWTTRADPRGGSEGGDEGDEESDTDARIKAHDRLASKRVADLAKAHPGRTLGVLTRRGRTAHLMIRLLRDEGIHASGEGGSPLTDEASVNVVLSAMQMADHPSDSAAAFHVARSPLAATLGMSGVGDAARVGRELRRSLLEQGYAKTVDAWARALAPNCSAQGAARLERLIELAHAFDTEEAELRPGDFVRAVEAAHVDDPTTARVRVMTIHAAKGLEFDIVALPELHPAFFSRRQAGLVSVLRDDPTGPIRAVVPMTKKEVRESCAELEAAHQENLRRELLDQLSVLYVAMTRAKFSLVMMIPPLKRIKSGDFSKTGTTSPSFAAILRHGLVGDFEAEGEAPEQMVYEHGDEGWDIGAASEEAAVTAPSARSRTVRLVTRGAARRSVPVVTPSSLESGGGVSVEDLLAMSTSDSRRRGTLIHKWFELVDFIGDDTGPSDDTLRESAKDVMGVRTPTQEQARWVGERLAEFRRMLASEPVRAALARPAGEFELWRERAFAVAQDGRVLRGQFDRVVVRRSGGAVVGADLVDFKTDQPVGGDVGPLVETYRPQIEAYRAAAASMLGVTVSAITARLLFVTLGKSVTL